MYRLSIKIPIYTHLENQCYYRIVVVHEAQPVRDLLRVAPQARHTPRSHMRMSGGLDAGTGREARTDCCLCWKQWNGVARCHHIPAGRRNGTVITSGTQRESKMMLEANSVAECCISSSQAFFLYL